LGLPPHSNWTAVSFIELKGIPEGRAKRALNSIRIESSPTARDCSLLQVSQHAVDLLKGASQVVCDFLGQYLWLRQVRGVLQRFVLEPEDIEAAFVARNKCS